MTQPLRTNLTRLAENVGLECRAIRTLINSNEAGLDHLATVDKSSLVAAINELKAGVGKGLGALIDDTQTRPDYTWSSTKASSYIGQQIAAAQSNLSGNAPMALNTLEKLASSLGNRADLYAYLESGLASRVRTDTPSQGLGLTERQNARTNIGAASQADLGPEVDYAALFRTGLL